MTVSSKISRSDQEAALRRLMLRDAAIWHTRTTALVEIQAREPPPHYYEQQIRPSLDCFDDFSRFEIGKVS